MGEGSPTKIDYRKKGTLILTSLLDLVVVGGSLCFSSQTQMGIPIGQFDAPDLTPLVLGEYIFKEELLQAREYQNASQKTRDARGELRVPRMFQGIMLGVQADPLKV